jgi:hypothetical protein
MFSYGAVEAALAAIHEIPKERLLALRGRLKHFSRLGMVPSSPGKGKKIAYSLENVYMWAICLELEEFGLDPVRIKEFLRLTYYQQIIAMLATGKGLLGEEAKNYFIFCPEFLKFDKGTLWTASCGFVDTLSEIETATWGRPVTGGRSLSERFKSRVAAINITGLRAAVQNALAK